MTRATKIHSEIGEKLALSTSGRATMGPSETKPDLWEQGVDDTGNDTT
jgi:hypothetical protein